MGSIISLYAVDNVQQFSTLASEVFTRNPKLFCSRFFTVIYLTFLSFKLGKLNNNKKIHQFSEIKVSAEMQYITNTWGDKLCI